MQSCNSNEVVAFLSGQLSGDEGARFEEHIDACSECRALLGALGRSGVVTLPPSGAEPEIAAPIRMGERIGRYVIIDWLGAGGMGVVYAAHDPELDRTVALKLLRHGASDTGSDHGERLLREARAMARVGHPNVVAVFDAGFHGERIFIAMERVDGTTLREWLAAEPRRRQEIVRVFVDAGRGIAAAHAAGLVHRDFKPENVLIGTDGRVRVTDFGLAREGAGRKASGSGLDSSSSSGEAAAMEVAASTAFGTPAYMSPEQQRLEQADARSDQFSFAVALYEGLYGERPFAGATLPALSENIMAERVGDPPKDSRVPSWLRRALLRSLRSRPEERYESMDALLGALLRNPYTRWRRRAFVLGWGAALGLGILSIGRMRDRAEPRCQEADQKLVGVWDGARKRAIHDAFSATHLPYAEHTFEVVSHTLDAYASQWTHGRTDACEATWVRGEQSAARLDLRMGCLDEQLRELHALSDVYARADAKTVQNAVVAAQSLPLPARCVDVKPREYDSPPPANPAAAARISLLKQRLAEIKAQGDAGHFKEARALIDEAVAEARSLGDPRLEAQALFFYGQLLVITQPKDAEATFYESAWAGDRAHDDTTRARAWIELLLLVSKLEQRTSDVPLFNSHAASAIARAGSDPALEFHRRHGLGTVYRRLGRYAESRAEFEAALGIARALYGPESQQAARCLNDVGFALHSTGEYPAAREYLESALANSERLLGPDHPEIARALNALGAVSAAESKYAESVQHLRRAVSIIEAAHGPVQSNLATYLDNLADSLRKEKKYDESLVMHLRALEIQEKLYGPDHPELVSSFLGLGLTAYDAGDLPSARRYLERALRLCNDATDPLFRADVQFGLARTLEKRQAARARALATAARNTYRASSGGNDVVLAEVSAWLATH